MHPALRRLIDASPAPIRPAVRLAVHTVVDAFDDRVPGLSAEVAFFLLLSLPPLLLTILTAAALLGEAVLTDFQARTVTTVTDVLSPALTPSATDQLASLVRTALENASGSVLSIGTAVTVVTASRALRVVTVAITIAYDLEDARPTWHQFVYGLALTVAVLVIATIVVPVFVAGPRLGRAIADLVDLHPLFGDVYAVAYWPVAVLGAIGLLAALYHVAAPWWTPWRRDLPGALLAVAVVVAGSAGLRVYARATLAGGETMFGPLAAPLVLLLWLYVVALGILLGAELNAELEKLHPSALPGGEAAEDEAVTRPRSTDADPG